MKGIDGSGSSNNSTSSKTPTTEELRERLQAAIANSLRKQENTVYRSPTSSGKSYFISTTRWREHPELTGGEPVIHLSPTTDARDEAYSKNVKSDAHGGRLRGREDACPLAAGDYDDRLRAPDGGSPSDWFSRMCDGRGLPLSVAHSLFSQSHNGKTPCHPCDALQQWENVPRKDCIPSKDVIFTTHEFARAPNLLQGCNVVIDELPDFGTGVETEDIRKSVTSYLKHVGAKWETWEDLATAVAHREKNSFLLDEFGTPERSWFLHDDDAHVLAPAIARALLDAEEQAHDRWKGELKYDFPDLNPHADTPNHRVQIRIVINHKFDIQLLHVVPDFNEARCVTGLDAHPTKSKWRAGTLQDIKFDRLLDQEEAQWWRRSERNLKIIQVGDNKNSWTRSGFSKSKVSGICQELRYQHGTDFSTGITAQRYEDELKESMRKAGVGSPETEYYGNLKSIETFESETVGLVAGCINQRAETVKDWLALLEKDATPKRDVDSSYEGQQWVGPDAEIAMELLADVREKKVLQAAGRYARSPTDPEDGATVWVMTNVLPDEFVDERVSDVQPLKEKASEIVAVLADSPTGMTIGEINEKVSASERHVYDVINDCVKAEWLSVNDETEPHVYHADMEPGAIVEL